MEEPLSLEAKAALQQLQSLGFKLDSTSGGHRLIRTDGSQVDFVSHTTRSQAALNAVPVAKAILKDEAARVKLGNVRFGKSLESRPYG